MTREDIDNIIRIICPNDEDFEKPIISPAYLKKELETLALEEEPSGDLISRQAVIDLISNFILEIHTEGGRDLNAQTNNVLRQILRNVGSDRVLPSVNPQEPTDDANEDTGLKLDEAIKRYANNAEFERTHGNLQGCLEFRQLAKWLRELKMYRHYLLKAEVEPQERSGKE